MIFSDDINYANQYLTNNFKQIKFELINNQFNEIEAIYLMSLCNINIIANSSFSWWGAWLNENNKKTFAPNNWFMNKYLNANDIYCDNWLKI